MLSRMLNLARMAGRTLPMLSGAVLFAGLCGGAALGQDFLNPGISALPGYEARGVKFNDILVKSYLSSGIAYDSNILQSSRGAIRDYIFFLSSTVDVTRSSGKSSQELFANVTSTKYAKSDNDSYTNVYVSGRELYSITANTQVFGSVSVFDGVERRNLRNFDIPTNAATPVSILNLTGTVGYTYTGKNFDMGANLSYATINYDNIRSISGAPIDQQFRNGRNLVLDSFFTISLSRYLKSSLSVQASDIEYKLQTRNYTQWGVSNTLTADLTSKTSIGFLVGVKEQDFYNNPTITSLTLLGEYQLQLEWRPTGLLSLRARGGYRDLGVDYVLGISGGFAHYYSLDARYLVWRNLQVTAGVDYEKDYLTGNQDVRAILTGKAGVTYDLSSHAGISLLYNFQQWDSRIPTNNFNENIFQSSLNLRF